MTERTPDKKRLIKGPQDEPTSDADSLDETRPAGQPPPQRGPLAMLAEVSTELANSATSTPVSDAQERMAKLSALKTRGGFGHFTVIEELGSGGFGTVFRALDMQLDREVAVKIIKSASLANSSRMLRRFREEARAAAQLRHPNIVPVHHSGEFAEDEAFIVFDFIPGKTLRQVLREQGPFSANDAVELLAKVADALGYAHSRGVVHLDVKPENILIEAETNEPHVADFGCARREYGEAGLAKDVRGHRIGTPSYFSPEQASRAGARTDARSDVWAMGIMLDELLTGKRTFRDDEADRDELYDAICHRDPVPLRERGRFGRDLEAIWRRCLQKDPAHRYATGRELTEDLQCWMQGRPVSARKIGPFERTARWARRHPALAASLSAVFLAVTLGLIVSLFFWQREIVAKRNLVAAQISRLVDASPDGVGEILHALEEDYLRDTTATMLQERWRAVDVDDGQDDRPTRAHSAHSRIALSLSRFEDVLKHDRRLSEDLEHCLIQSALHVDPREQLLIHENLAGDRREVRRGFEAVAVDPSVDSRQRLRAVCGMLFHAPAPNESLPEIPDALRLECLGWLRHEVNVVGRFDPHWVRLLQPLRETFRQPLESLLIDEHGMRHGTEATILFEFFADQPEYVAEQLFVVHDSYVSELMLRLRTSFRDSGSDEEYHSLIRKHTQSALRNAPPGPRRSVVLARSLVAQLSVSQGPTDRTWYDGLGDGDSSMPDTTAWASFCDLADDYGMSRDRLHTLALQSRTAGDDHVLRNAILALGEFSSPGSNRKAMSQWLQELWREHPDSGVHFSCDWLIRRWSLGSMVERTATTSGYDDGRTWRYDGSREMVRFSPRPIERIGSPDEERVTHSRSHSNHVDFEAQYQVQVDWDFELAAYEVTVGEFREFLRSRVKEIEATIADLEQSETANRDIERLYDSLSGFDNLLLRSRSPENDLPSQHVDRGHPVTPSVNEDRIPMTNVSWYDAVEYCVWMSHEAGLESCYGSLEAVVRARQQRQSLNVDLLKNGYRLPTSIEWEIACRGGTTTPWFYGHRPELAGRYANCLLNSSLTLSSTGLFRPNPKGLFDMAGNVSEWMSNVARPNPRSETVRLGPREVAADAELNREIRGGHYGQPLSRLRSAAKSFLRPDGHSETIGLRMARTLPRRS